MIWTYSINLHQMASGAYKMVEAPDVATLPVISTLTGTIEADNYTYARAMAWNIVSSEIKARKQFLGFGDLHVAQQDNGKLEVEE